MARINLPPGIYKLKITNVFFNEQRQKWAFTCSPLNPTFHKHKPVLRWFKEGKLLESFLSSFNRPDQSPNNLLNIEFLGKIGKGKNGFMNLEKVVSLDINTKYHSIDSNQVGEMEEPKNAG